LDMALKKVVGDRRMGGVNRTEKQGKGRYVNNHKRFNLGGRGRKDPILRLAGGEERRPCVAPAGRWIA